MSKIALTPNANGSGVFTLASPNSNTNRTITLPDESVTLGAGTPSIDDNGNATAITIDSSESVLIGKTALGVANAGFAVRNFGTGSGGGTTIELAKDDATAMYINRTSSDGEIIALRKDNTSVGSIGVSGTRMHLLNGDTGLRFAGDTNSIFPCTTAGADSNNAIDLGASGNRFKDFYVGGGVYLGGTGSANYLDDYEEGSFLPTFLGDTTNPSVTYQSARKGVYVKVGDIVHISIFIEITALASSGSGGLAVGNLPFTSSGTIYHAGTVGYASSWDTNKTPTRCLVVPNSTKIALYHQTTSDPRSGTTRVQAGDLDTQSQIYVQVSYRLT